MLKFQLMTAQDIKEAAAIERRRQIEEDRKKRIFNARNRLIGVDYDALEKQICEKKIREQQEKELHELFARQQIRDDQIALALEKQEVEEKKKIEQDINEFRKLYQRAQDRREYDINDPNILKNSLPPRLKDDDPRLGLSSAQKFEGEDPTNSDRMIRQREQIKSFLEQQIQERNAADREYKAAEKAYQDAVIQRDFRCLELMKIEDDCRKKLNEATTNFNLALLQEQREIKKMEDLHETEANNAEIYNALTGDFLTEANCAESNFGPNRAQGFKYKGMTEEEKMRFRDAQRKQVEENKKKKLEEERLKKYWDDYAVQLDKQLLNMDREQKQKRMTLNKELAEANKQLAIQQRQQQEYLEKVVYTNKPTASFFNSFNTTTR